VRGGIGEDFSIRILNSIGLGKLEPRRPVIVSGGAVVVAFGIVGVAPTVISTGDVGAALLALRDEGVATGKPLLQVATPEAIRPIAAATGPDGEGCLK